MSAGPLLQRLATKLDAAAIPYMVAGSFASTYHGVPRTTQAIDIVIAEAVVKARLMACAAWPVGATATGSSPPLRTIAFLRSQSGYDRPP